MKIKRIHSVFILLIFLCSCKTEIKNNKLPKTTLVKGDFSITNNNILYQFYEEFGFDEVCTHTRTFFKVENFKRTSEWKKLPMLKSEVNKLILIPNKIDTLNNKEIIVKYTYKTYFNDISLNSKEYIKDSNFNQKVSLIKGYYKIEGNTFLIFNNNKNTIYYEEHYCN